MYSYLGGVVVEVLPVDVAAADTRQPTGDRPSFLTTAFERSSNQIIIVIPVVTVTNTTWKRCRCRCGCELTMNICFCFVFVVLYKINTKAVLVFAVACTLNPSDTGKLDRPSLTCLTSSTHKIFCGILSTGMIEIWIFFLLENNCQLPGMSSTLSMK